MRFDLGSCNTSSFFFYSKRFLFSITFMYRFVIFCVLFRENVL